MGRMPLPLYPPYVVFFSEPTAGQALESGKTPIKPDTVFVAVTPSAPPRRAASAMTTISVTFGVNFANTGVVVVVVVVEYYIIEKRVCIIIDEI